MPFLIARALVGGSEQRVVKPSEIREAGVDSAKAVLMAQSVNTASDSVSSLPYYDKFVEDATDSESPFLAGAEFGRQGLAYFSPSQIDSIARVRSVLLGKMSDRECAKYASGEVSQEFMYRVLDRLDQRELRAFLYYTREASYKAFLNGRPAAASENETKHSMRALIETMDQTERKRLFRLTQESEMSGNSLCWFERVLWERIPEVPDSTKPTLVRGLLSSGN